jgi:hypothetical protein
MFPENSPFPFFHTIFSSGVGKLSFRFGLSHGEILLAADILSCFEFTVTGIAQI